MIIGITGAMFTGKSTVYQLIASKQKCVNIRFSGAIYDIQEAIYAIVGLPVPYPKDRKLLQYIGTDWGRSLNENLWVNVWKTRITDWDRTIITDDVRFPNEAAALKEVGGVLIKIVASEAVRAQRGEMINTSHASEAGIPDADCDWIIDNNGSLYDLELKVKEILSNLENHGNEGA